MTKLEECAEEAKEEDFTHWLHAHKDQMLSIHYLRYGTLTVRYRVKRRCACSNRAQRLTSLFERGTGSPQPLGPPGARKAAHVATAVDAGLPRV